MRFRGEGNACSILFESWVVGVVASELLSLGLGACDFCKRMRFQLSHAPLEGAKTSPVAAE
jgi:hypothetical protein